MKAIVEGACWFGAGIVLWLATVTTVTWVETLIATATSAACAVLAVAARRIAGLRVRASGQWLRWLGLVPAQAAADTVRLAGWLARGAHDRPESEAVVERRVTAGRSPHAVGLRAAATGVVSATPGSVVVDADADGRFLTHRLVGGSPQLDERVSR